MTNKQKTNKQKIALLENKAYKLALAIEKKQKEILRMEDKKFKIWQEIDELENVEK